MSTIYEQVIGKLTASAIYNMKQEHIPSYKEVLKDMEDEFDILDMNIAVCRRESVRKNLCDIRDKLEAYYRNKYKDILFPLFIPFSTGRIFDDISTKEFILCTRQFFIKRWKNNLYYCLPVDSYNPAGVISIIPPEELDEDVKGFDTPTTAMLDFYIHLLEEVQKTYGIKNPYCDKRTCEYNYGRKCIYEDVAVPHPEKKLCGNGKDVK